MVWKEALDAHQNGDVKEQHRANQRHQKVSSKENQRHQAEHPYGVVHTPDILREKMTQHVAAIQWRNGDQIKYCEQDVDLEEGEEQQACGDENGVADSDAAQGALNNDSTLRGGDGDCGQQDRRASGNDEIADWTGDGRKDIVEDGTLEISGIDWRRFGPTDDGQMGQHGDERKDHGTEGVDVFEGIQRDASQHASRGVAAAVRGPRMGGLVDADGEQESDQLEQDVNELQAHSILDLILTRWIRVTFAMLYNSRLTA